jgi:Ni,Fe-hydrogenase I small subunit
MNKITTDIPKDAAFQLCAEIRWKYQGKWWTFAGMQCVGCNAATKGDITKRCVCNAPGNRGCNLVNARYDRQVKMAL